MRTRVGARGNASQRSSGDSSNFLRTKRGGPGPCHTSPRLGHDEARATSVTASAIRLTEDLKDYSPVSNIGDIWSLEEGSDEGSIVLDIGEVGLNAFLQHFV
jgi:hypothetical protein